MSDRNIATVTYTDGETESIDDALDLKSSPGFADYVVSTASGFVVLNRTIARSVRFTRVATPAAVVGKPILRVVSAEPEPIAQDVPTGS